MNSENHLKDKLIACGHDDSVHFTSPGLRAFLLFRDGSFYTVSPVSAYVSCSAVVSSICCKEITIS